MSPQQVSSQPAPSPLMTLDLRKQKQIEDLRERQMYQMPRPHEQQMPGGDPGQHYGRPEGGEGEADAEGERDYEVT